MTNRSSRARNLTVLPAALAAILGGCAVDQGASRNETPITGRQITQEAPAPDHSVYYWSALRSCLQTGRSEWECKSGEDRFVRDALAIEAELNAQRQQRRLEMRSRAEFESPETGSTGDATRPVAKASRTRSLMIRDDSELEAPSIPEEHQWELASANEGDGTGR